MAGARIVRAAAGVLLLLPSLAQAQRAVFVVRHAEKASDANEASVPLSEAGTARAKRLAEVLKDAGVTAICSTDTVRTRGTAEPLAQAKKLAIEIYSARDAQGKPSGESLALMLREKHRDDVVLVVGHSNTVPAALEALGVAEKVAIGDDEYDSLFVVVPRGSGPPALLRLRY